MFSISDASLETWNSSGTIHKSASGALAVPGPRGIINSLGGRGGGQGALVLRPIQGDITAQSQSKHSPRPVHPFRRIFFARFAICCISAVGVVECGATQFEGLSELLIGNCYAISAPLRQISAPLRQLGSLYPEQVAATSVKHPYQILRNGREYFLVRLGR